MTRALIAVVFISNVLLTACAELQGSEQAIKGQITGMEDALAERSPMKFMATLAESFLGGRSGQLDTDKEAARKMLAVYFLRYHRIRVSSHSH